MLCWNDCVRRLWQVVDEMIAIVDKDGDNQLNFEEFFGIMTGEPPLLPSPPPYSAIGGCAATRTVARVTCMGQPICMCSLG